MAYTPHAPVKPEKIVGVAKGLIEPKLMLHKLVTRERFDQIAYAKDDTLTYTLPGILPYRTMPFRDPRNNPLIYDVYKEAKTTITFGGYIYNGVKMTDEQAQFDLKGWAALLSPQAQAVAAGVNQAAADLITGAPFEVELKGIGSDANWGFRKAFNEARRIHNRIGTPAEGRIAIIGTDVENAILNEDKLTLAQYVGDEPAGTALREAIVGRLSGFTLVTSNEINPAEVYFMVPSGYVQLLSAPLVPQSVPYGSTVSEDGLSFRWMRDYDTDFRTDRSVVDTWEGHNFVKDRFLPEAVLATANPHTAFDPANMASYFVRAIKGSLDGLPADSIYPSATVGAKRPAHGTGASGNADAAEVARTADLRANTGISSAETRRWGV